MANGLAGAFSNTLSTVTSMLSHSLAALHAQPQAQAVQATAAARITVPQASVAPPTVAQASVTVKPAFEQLVATEQGRVSALGNGATALLAGNARTLSATVQHGPSNECGRPRPPTDGSPFGEWASLPIEFGKFSSERFTADGKLNESYVSFDSSRQQSVLIYNEPNDEKTTILDIKTHTEWELHNDSSGQLHAAKNGQEFDPAGNITSDEVGRFFTLKVNEVDVAMVVTGPPEGPLHGSIREGGVGAYNGRTTFQFDPARQPTPCVPDSLPPTSALHSGASALSTPPASSVGPSVEPGSTVHASFLDGLINVLPPQSSGAVPA